MKKRVLGFLLTCVMFVSCMPAAAMAATADHTDAAGYVGGRSYEFNSAVNAEGRSDLGVVGQVDADGEVGFSGYTVCETTLVPIGDHTYQIATEDDRVIGIYEEGPVVIPRGGGQFSWTANAGQSRCSDTPVESYDGFEISFSVSFSRSGSTRVGFGAVEEGVFYTIFTKTSGFSGTITFYESHGPVVFGFCNDSDHSITYSGSFSY